MRTLVPRHFALQGLVREWVPSTPATTLAETLAPHVTYTLDSALEQMGYRRWGPGGDLWVYVRDWNLLEALEEQGCIVPLQASAPPGSTVLHACLPSTPVKRVSTSSAASFVVTPRRLLEELLGAHGLRFDLFARLAGDGPLGCLED